MKFCEQMQGVIFCVAAEFCVDPSSRTEHLAQSIRAFQKSCVSNNLRTAEQNLMRLCQMVDRARMFIYHITNIVKSNMAASYGSKQFLGVHEHIF